MTFFHSFRLVITYCNLKLTNFQTKKSAKKRPKNDNNKHGKKEQPDKEEANQNEKPMTKEDTTILYRGFSHIKGLVAYLCLMIFKSPYTVSSINYGQLGHLWTSD